MNSADWIILIVAAYGMIGGIFAVAFVAAGAARIDPAARGSPLALRVLLMPGATALWPLLLRKWIDAS